MSFNKTLSIVTPDPLVFSLIVSTFNVELQVISPAVSKLFIEISDDDVIVACLLSKAVCNPAVFAIVKSPSAMVTERTPLPLIVKLVPTFTPPRIESVAVGRV